MKDFKVAIISSSANQWPLYVGVEEGFFAKEGLEVEIVVTSSSKKHLEALTTGGVYDIGHQAADHIVKSVVKNSDLFMFMGISQPNQSLIVQPEIKGYSDLKGKQLGVDGTTSGYAILLKELLKRNGLIENEDYSLVPIGGTGERYKAIQNKEVAGAFIDGPVDLKAEERGYNRIGSNHDLGLEYQGTVAATKREWVKDNADALVKYIKGYVAATDWLYNKENRTRAVEILKKHVDVSSELAIKTYDRYIDLEIFNPKATLNIRGLEKVIEIMQKSGELETISGELKDFYDLSYYEKALE